MISRLIRRQGIHKKWNQQIVSADLDRRFSRRSTRFVSFRLGSRAIGINIVLNVIFWLFHLFGGRALRADESVYNVPTEKSLTKSHTSTGISSTTFLDLSCSFVCTQFSHVCPATGGVSRSQQTNSFLWHGICCRFFVACCRSSFIMWGKFGTDGHAHTPAGKSTYLSPAEYINLSRKMNKLFGKWQNTRVNYKKRLLEQMDATLRNERNCQQNHQSQ